MGAGHGLGSNEELDAQLSLDLARTPLDLDGLRRELAKQSGSCVDRLRTELGLQR